MENNVLKRGLVVLSLLALIAGNPVWGARYGIARVEVYSAIGSETVPNIGEVAIGNNSFSNYSTDNFENRLIIDEYNKDYNVKAKLIQSDGWYFYGWDKSTDTKNPTSTSLNATLTFTATGYTTWTRNTDIYYAIFKPVEVTTSTETIEVNPTELHTVYHGTITFQTTGADNMKDFDWESANQTDPRDGEWIFGEPQYANNTVTVAYTYQATRNTYKNSKGTRADEATFTLISKGDNAKRATCHLTATFPKAEVLSATARPDRLSPIVPTTPYEGAADFIVRYADEPLLSAVSFGTPTGGGEWEVRSLDCKKDDADANQATITVKYIYTTGDKFAVRQNSNTLTLNLDGGGNGSCTITADFPAIDFSEKENAGVIVTLSDQTQPGMVVFDVMYADGVGDFQTPVISPVESNVTWTVGTPVFKTTTLPASTLTIPYTFAHSGELGNYSATLTLTTKDGTSSKSIPLSATVKEDSQHDVRVIASDGSTITEEQWANGLFIANQSDSCTLQLLKHVNLQSSQEIKRDMTLDLNGYTLSADLTTTYKKLLYLNTAGKTLTITDSRSNGAIVASGNYNDLLYAVELNKGNLVLKKGRIEAINSITSNEDKKYAVAVYQAGNTVFTMNGGELKAVKPTNRNAYGLYMAAGAKATLHAGTIDVAAGSYAYGLYMAAGAKATLHAGTIDVAAGSYAYGVWAASSATAPSQLTVVDAQINGTATTSAYGIYSYGEVNISGGTVAGTTKDVNGVAGGNTAYGIYMYASANAVAANCYYGTLKMTGGTIIATTKGTEARGIYLGGAEAGSPIDKNAPEPNTNKAFAVGNIANARISATAGTTTARGVMVYGNYNSKDDQTFVTRLENCTIEATALGKASNNNGSAYGVWAFAGANNQYGNCYHGDVELVDCNVTATTKQGNGAYAVGGEVASITLNHTNTPQQWKGKEFATAAKVTIDKGVYTAKAAGATAKGIQMANTAVSATGKASASGELIVRNATITVTAGTYDAYGINTSGETTIDNCDISASAQYDPNVKETDRQSFVRALVVNDKKTTLTNSRITATAFRGSNWSNGAMGIYVGVTILNNAGNAGWKYWGELESNNNTITATTTDGGNAYGLYLATTSLTTTKLPTTNPDDAYLPLGEYAVASKAVINGGSFTATAQTTNAYGIQMANTAVSATGKASASGELIMHNATITATAGTYNAYGINTSGETTIDNCDISASAQYDPNVKETDRQSFVRALVVNDKKTTLTNSRITATAFRGSNWSNGAMGIYVGVTILNNAGNAGWKYWGELESNNNTITATTTDGAYATGLYLHATSIKTTALPTNPDDAYLPLGEYAVASKAVINGGSFTATAQTTNAYGIQMASTVVSATGKASASGELIMHKATITATAGTTTARGIYTSGPTIIDDCNITATASADYSNVRGLYVYDKKTTITNSTITVTGKTGNSIDNGATGIYLDAAISNTAGIAGWKYYGELESNGNIVTATTTEGAYATGLYLPAKSQKTDKLPANPNDAYRPLGEYAVATNAVINGGSYTATAKTSNAKGISMGKTAVSTTGKASASGKLTVRNANIQAKTNSTTAYGIETSGPTFIDNCTILALAGTTTARGICINDSLATITNSTITAQGTGVDANPAEPDPTKNSVSVYGIYANASIDTNTDKAGWEFAGALESKGNTITATALNGYGAYGLWLHADVQSITATGDAYRPSGDYAVAASAVLDGDTYKATASAKTAYALAVEAEKSKNEEAAAPSIIVNSGKFWGEAPSDFADINANGLKGNLLINDGYFRNSTNVAPYIREGYSLFDFPIDTKEYEYKEGYRYFVAPASASGTYVCEVVETEQKYKTLEEALQFVNLNSNSNSNAAYTIRMLANYTLPAGDYVLPAKATLLIPYTENQTKAVGKSPERAQENGMVPYAYITLTFASGVNMIVFGTIEVGAKQWATNPSYSGVYGSYGQLDLEDNVILDLESGAQLMAWGYVTGKGLINAKKGASLYEMFQLGDWKGGGVTTWMVKGGLLTNISNKQKIFPLTHYFYQNIEASVLYRPGSQAIGVMAVTIDGGIVSYDNIKIIGASGSGSLFLMDDEAISEDTYIRKNYDPLTDRTTWILNNNSTLGAVSFTVEFAKQSVNVKSSDYVLPLSSNMNIVAQSGIIDMEQDTYIMPGTIFEIKKDATFIVSKNKKFYVVDKNQWVTGYGNGNTYIWTPYYSPSWQNQTKSPRSYMKSDKTYLPSAEIFVHGAIEVEGNLYTTADGANIHSTNEDAGKISFKTEAPALTKDNFYQCNTNCGSKEIIFGVKDYYWNYETYSLTSAQLKNGNDTYTQTASTNAGESFIYVENRWIKTVDNGCMSTVTDETGEHLYIHASDMVEVLENGDHAYKDKATGTDTRYFINTNATKGQASCVWWEVEPKDNGFYMANQEKYDNNGTYYYYDAASDFWKPKTVTITWKNYDGTTLAVYSDVSYNTSPKYLGATPTRQNTAIAKYAWTGWTDQNGNFYEKNRVLPLALTDMTYTAYFAENKYQYTVTFRNWDGSLIESGLWTVDSVPVCSVTPERAPDSDNEYRFIGWTKEINGPETEIEPVSDSPAEYFAKYTSVGTRQYTVTFQDYNGDMLYQNKFPKGTTPVYSGELPHRDNTTAYSYTWKGWRALTDNTVYSGTLPDVKADAIYVADYDVTELEYGEALDIVDATADYLLLNMQGYTSPTAYADWTLKAFANKAVSATYTKAQREPNRTLRIALTEPETGMPLQPADRLLIESLGKDNKVESHRYYTIPFVVDGNTTISNLGSAIDGSSVIFVHNGATLTIDRSIALRAVYVAPEAEIIIPNGVTLTLTDCLVLRTSHTSSAVLTNYGLLNCRKCYYSRVTYGYKGVPLQMALPFEVDLTKVVLSNGKPAVFGSHFGLMYYDADQRADNGFAFPNWKGLQPLAASSADPSPTHSNTLKACEGYQLISPSAYYYEYRFPVNYVPTADNVDLSMAYKEGEATLQHWGWNYLCSPYTSKITIDVANLSPEDMVKVHNLKYASDNSIIYEQVPLTELNPAMAFFYQTSEQGLLHFSAADVSFSATPAAEQSALRRVAAIAPQPTQWIRLYYGDWAGAEHDETNLYFHPNKFTVDYDMGYDVLKLSTLGSSPLIYASLPCGDMAFTALPDVATEQGISLTVSAPVAGDMYFSLQTNQHLTRMEHVYLLDKETTNLTDLLHNDYVYRAEAGVSSGRFMLLPIFKSPDVVTEDTHARRATDDFKVYAMSNHIIVEQLPAHTQVCCYDMVGKLLATGVASDAGVLTIDAPTNGVYLIYATNKIKKVIVRP